MSATFADATFIRAIDSHKYAANFHEDWCIGSVPHGGYVAAHFLRVAALHSNTTCRSYNQPHTLALQLNFARRTSKGAATFTVSELKLGRRTSTIHIILTQNDQPACVVGYLTQTNLHTESGVSLPTQYILNPRPLPLSSTGKLIKDEDPHWAYFQKPFLNFRKALGQVKTYLPRKGVVGGEAVLDQWLCMTKPGERFTQDMLGFVADIFPQIIETIYSPSELASALSRLEFSKKGTADEATTILTASSDKTGLDRSQWAKFWYPTVTLNIDFKKALPSEGEEWLFSRVRAKAIKNGRMDLEVTILDEWGNIVALSTHVALIVGAERNIRRNGGNGKVKGESKL